LVWGAAVLLRRFSFSPLGPEKQRQRSQSGREAPPHPTPKEKQIWRAAGLNGQAVWDAPPVGFTFDNTPFRGTPGVLVAFLTAGERLPEGPNKRRRAVLRALAQCFGEKALKPTAYFETDWGKDAWTAGCVSPLGPGLLTRYGTALREPVGRIHWAGTETSEVWTGYMEGAVRSASASRRRCWPG
jgi:monoamine oxidase